MAERDQLFQEEYRSRRKPLSTAFFPNISLLAYFVMRDEKYRAYQVRETGGRLHEGYLEANASLEQGE